MATLAGNTIASTYPLLLKINSNGIDGTLRAVQDGDATDSAVKISTKAMSVTGTLTSDTQTTPETILTLAATYANTGSDGGAGSGSRIEFQIPDDETNPITGAAIAGIKEAADDSDASAGMAFYVSQNDTTLDEVMRITSTGKLFINQDSNSMSIDIDSEATTEPVIQVDSPASTTHPIVNLTNLDSLTTGEGLRVHSNSSSNGSRSLVHIINDHASATNTIPLKIQQDSLNVAFSIDDPKCTSDNIMQITNADALTGGGILYLESDASDNSTRNLLTIVNDNASADNTVGLYIKQDGADASIELAGNGSIKFPGTQGASSDANSLDDYEEGAWTPQFGDASSGGTLAGVASATGRYVKIGQLVYITGELNVNSLSSITMGNSVHLRNLPFSTQSSTSNIYQPINVGYTTNLNISAGVSIAGYLDHNAGYFGVMTAFDAATGITDLTFTELSDNANITISAVYATN